MTGGAGFLGSHLCDAASVAGPRSAVRRQLLHGHKRNIAHLLDHPRFELLRHDVTFPLYVEVDEIYNLACPASPIHYQHDPVQTTKTSVHGAINMLGLAKRVQVRASSRRRPARCTAIRRCTRSRSPTGATSIRSACARATTKASAAPRRCSSTITASTSCGSRSRASSTPTGRACIPNDGRVVSNFIVQALKNEPITIYGDGAQTRSFCYVDDLIDGFVALMDTPDEFTGPVNLGNPTEFTIAELARAGHRSSPIRARGSCSGRCRRTIRASASRIQVSLRRRLVGTQRHL